jgi:glycosyltransferase involved in cell wall biosynthesis
MVSKQNPVSVSVVVAAYGDVPYLEETLRSLVVTQPDSVPIFVLDDCSPTPDVHEIAQRFSDRITYIRSEVNRGVSGSFNTAADLVDTEYLMLVGPDDRVTTSIEGFLQGIESEAFDAVVIQPGVSVIDSSGERVRPLNDRVKDFIAPKKDSIHSGEDLAVTLLKGDWAYNPSLLWKVSYLQETRYSESLKTAMDLDILLRLTFEGKSLYRSKAKVFEYRRHSEAVSSKNAGSQQFGEELSIHGWAYESAKSKNWRAAMRWARWAPTPRLHAMLLLKNQKSTDRKVLWNQILAGIGK